MEGQINNEINNENSVQMCDVQNGKVNHIYNAIDNNTITNGNTQDLNGLYDSDGNSNDDDDEGEGTCTTCSVADGMKK